MTVGYTDAIAQSGKIGFRMDWIRNFELVVRLVRAKLVEGRSTIGRKSADPGLSRDAGRPFALFGSRVCTLVLLFAAVCCWGAAPADNAEKFSKEEMRSLYRSNPEAFRKVMRERAEKQRAAERAFNQKLDAMGKQYRESNDPAEKERLKKEITAQAEADYLRHVKRGRERLEELKKRVAALETEQTRREKSVKEAVDFRVSHILSGEPMPPPPGKRPPRPVR